MRVVLTGSAKADLREIGRWIGRDDPARAVSFVRELRAKCAGLADQPLSFPILEAVGPHIRKRTHGRYLILYRVRTAKIEIVHIVHGSRDYTRLFGPP